MYVTYTYGSMQWMKSLWVDSDFYPFSTYHSVDVYAHPVDG